MCKGNLGYFEAATGNVIKEHGKIHARNLTGSIFERMKTKPNNTHRKTWNAVRRQQNHKIQV